MNLKPNEGRTDRIIRAVLGLVFAYLGFAYSAWFYIIAAILLFTAATGHCTIYNFFKFNTLEKGRKKK